MEKTLYKVSANVSLCNLTKNTNVSNKSHEGIKSKFVQNPLLLQMLKATGKKVIVEASTDKLWGTGVVLRDNQVLNPNRWHNVGWMSSILMDIRDNT